ncbi:YPDG domain-containing protein, partial [Arcanobacterium haemolyticum]|nr:YPDG domain-containing protein [Arcanobacterium haemolyticum]
TTFAKADGAPDWVESVDAATGAIKVKPGYSVEPKTYDVPVTVTFPGTNGGSTTAVAKVTVEAANAQNVTFGISVGNQWLGGTNSCEALGNLKDGVSIVLVAEDGTKYRSDVNGWGCPDNFPAYQGFGEKLIPFGDYTVIVEGEDTIADEGYVIDVPNYPYTTYAYPNATISIDGKRGQIYLDLLPFNKAYTPSYTAISVNQGDEGTVVAPTFDNTLTSDVETGAAPEGTTFAKADGAPDWVESVDAATGAIKVKPGYSVEPKTYDVPVTVTFPGTNGGTTDAIAKVTVTTKSTTPGFDPNGTDEDGNPFVVNPSANGSQECGVKPYIVLPADAGVIYTVKDAKGAVVTPDASGHYVIAYGTEVTVTAAPGEGYSFPEGATTTWTVTVEKTAECQPSWDDATTIPGEPITVPNTGGPVDEGTTVEVDGPGTAVINPDGSITVTPGDDAKPGDTITVTVKDPNGKTIDEITVTIDDTPTTPTFDPNGTDEDGNPFVVNPSADDPAECTVKPYVVLPNDEGVTYVVTDANGNVIEPDASGHYVYAYGTEVTVTASPAEGFAFPADATTTWTFSSQKAAVCEPKWEDSTTKPGEPITVPNTGGPVDEGTTIEVDGPGTAVINPDGSITVTPGDDAKPGDTITVTVKDPNGKTIDEMTITIGKPDAQPTKPAPAAATLPFTGASAIGFGIAAAVLVLGGGVVLFGAKARREK